ncbi:MAG: hypothetical protein K8R58_13950 [Bacteroidales bacterium]|nr:hypothetical protein [Bacteroidales bacterium]
MVFDADFSGLADGNHILLVRVRDENGNWSLVYADEVYKFTPPDPTVLEQLPNIVAMEYFFDNDPGFGNGVSIPVTSDSLIEVVFNADFSGLPDGYHNLLVRVKDENGNWSLVYTDEVYKFTPPNPTVLEQLPNIVAMEYFIDIDPGFGNGTEILNTPDSLIVETFVADISALAVGGHLMFIRVKDENNRWSHSVIEYFCIKGLQAFLEGPYNSIAGLMSTALNNNGLLPLEQPFDSDPAAVWYYDGNETVAAIPNANIVDWLLLQARDATSAANATSATIKENQVAFLLKDGKIVGLDGDSLISFSEPIDNDLYLVIFQRNHLGIMSSFPLDTSGDCAYTYNFSTGADQVYGGSLGHKEIGTGVWGMIGGDGDANSQIGNADKNDVWAVQAGSAGYLSGDFTMDVQVNNSDKNDIWAPNSGKGGQVPDNIPQGGFKCMVPE